MQEDTYKPDELEARMWDALNGFEAYEIGATDSGVHDERLRAEVKAWLRGMPKGESRLTLSRYVRQAYLSEEALEKGYGIQEAWECLRWLLEFVDYDF